LISLIVVLSPLFIAWKDSEALAVLTIFKIAIDTAMHGTQRARTHCNFAVIVSQNSAKSAGISNLSTSANNRSLRSEKRRPEQAMSSKHRAIRQLVTGLFPKASQSTIASGHAGAFSVFCGET
jgi:hypothetical protein